jgi:hypothetical protein
MDVFVIQLAKMTLICIGIFFTPAITRKFVVHLRAPAAQEMMKWGGMALGVGAVVGAKSMMAAKLVGGAGFKGVQKELPSLTQGLTEVSRRWASSQTSSPIRKFSRNFIEKVNSKVQEGHLKREFERQNRVGRSSDFESGSFKENSASQEKSGGGRLSGFESFKKQMGEKRDPISGAFEYRARPRPGVMAALISGGSKASTRSKELIQASLSGLRGEGNRVSARGISRSGFANERGPTLPKPPGAASSSVGVASRSSPSLRTDGHGEAAPSNLSQRSFSGRLRSIMNRNLKQMMKIKEKK